MLAVIPWAALVLAALAPAFTRADVYDGSDSHWQAVPSTVQSTTVPLDGLGCLTGAIGRVLTAGDRIELFFEGTDLELYGIPAPNDVHVQYEMDWDEQQAPDPSANIDGSASTCRRITAFHSLPNKLHNLTIVVNPSDSGRSFQYIIANATTINDNADSSSQSISVQDVSTSTSTSKSQLPSGTEYSSTSTSSTVPAKGDTHNAIIAGATIGGLILFFATGFGIYALVRRRRNRVPPSAAFKARMARAEFVMVNAENDRSGTPLPSAGTANVV